MTESEPRMLVAGTAWAAHTHGALTRRARQIATRVVAELVEVVAGRLRKPVTRRPVASSITLTNRSRISSWNSIRCSITALPRPPCSSGGPVSRQTRGRRVV